MFTWMDVSIKLTLGYHVLQDNKSVGWIKSLSYTKPNSHYTVHIKNCQKRRDREITKFKVQKPLICTHSFILYTR